MNGFCKLNYFFLSCHEKKLLDISTNLFTFNAFSDDVNRHDAMQLRGSQWAVSTPPLRDKAYFRVLLS